MTGYDPKASGPWSDSDDYPPGTPSLGAEMAADPFTADLVSVLGERIKADHDFACRVWGSVANVEWSKEDGTQDAGHSFRSIGSVLAMIRGNYEPYNYMDFYCSVPAGVIDPEVAAVMGAIGWRGSSVP